jgi:hypothetical protein
LSEDIGPRLAGALGEDLVAALNEQLPTPERITIPPASLSRSLRGSDRPRAPSGSPLAVALVDADCVGRTALARALVRERWNVTLVDSEGDAANPDPFDVALVDAAHPAAKAILESLARTRPGLAVVVRTKDAAKTRAHVSLLAVGRVVVTADEASLEDLVKAVRQACACARDSGSGSGSTTEA